MLGTTSAPVLLCACFLFACEPKQDSKDSSAPRQVQADASPRVRTKTERQLEGRRFLLESAEGMPQLVSAVEVSFDDQKIRFHECNGTGGEYRLVGEVLEVKAWPTTDMSCGASLIARKRRCGASW